MIYISNLLVVFISLNFSSIIFAENGESQLQEIEILDTEAEKLEAEKDTEVTKKSGTDTSYAHLDKNNLFLGVSTAGGATPFSILFGYEYNYEGGWVNQIYSNFIFGNTLVYNQNGDFPVITMYRYQYQIGVRKSFHSGWFLGGGISYLYTRIDYNNPAPFDINDPYAVQVFIYTALTADLNAGWTSDGFVNFSFGINYSFSVLEREKFSNKKGEQKISPKGRFGYISESYDHKQETESIYFSSKSPLSIYTGMGIRF